MALLVSSPRGLFVSASSPHSANDTRIEGTASQVAPNAARASVHPQSSESGSVDGTAKLLLQGTPDPKVIVQQSGSSDF